MGLDVTASKTGLLFECRYAFRSDVEIPVEAEPEEVDDEEDEEDDPAARGTRVHEAIEKGTPVPPEEQGYVDAAKKWIDLRGDGKKEVAFDWDGETATIIGFGREAYKNKRPTAIMTGTADIVLPGELADWKTSEHSALKARLQLRTLALFAGTELATSVELRADGTFGEHFREVLEPWDLAEHADRLRAAIAAIPDSPPVLGEHCADYFCPLKGTCPAYVEAVETAVAELIPADALVRRKVTDPIADAQDLALAVDVLAALGPWIKLKKKEMKAFTESAGGSVRLDDKHVFREVQSKRTNVRGKEAVALAEKLGANLEDLASLTYTTTISSFKRVRSNTK